MSSTKSFINTFMLAIATLAITACVPKATEKKAVCGANQAFSTVSRSCYSIEELRAKPVGTTATVSMLAETPQTITLAYTDANKDKAVSCKVSSITTSLEMVAPSIADGGLFDKSDEVYQAASNLATALATSEVAMRDALLAAKGSVHYPTVVAQLGVFKAQATSILALGAGSANPTVQYYYTLGQERMSVLTSMMTNMTNRCECSGGICTTVAIPKLNKSGAAGFTYTITDIDGEGAAKSTAVTITAMPTATAHLKPVASPGYISLNESSTTVATAYGVTIPEGNDLTGIANASMKYYFNGSKNASNQGVTTKGKVTGCMDLTGSTGLTDRTCIYTPTNGDDYDVIAPVKASAVIGDLTFSGVAEGAAANNFTVQYFDLHSNNLAVDPYVSFPQVFGLVSGSEEAFIRVVGNAIRVFINPGVTSSTQIQNLVNNHPQAKLMVSVSGATGAMPSPSVLTASPVSLTGGVDSFDKIPYYVNNSQNNSTNTAYLMIKMNSVDDVPAMNYVASASATYLEDPTPSPMLINLSSTYSDVDTNASSPGPGYYNICNVDPADAIFLTNFDVNSCTCVLSVCTVSITPHADVSSTTPFTFSYRIGSVDSVLAVTKYSEYRNFSLKMTPINDAPQISTSALPIVTVVPDKTIQEGATTFIDVWIGPGGSGFETSQALTLTATSSNLTLLPAANVVVSDTSPVVVGKKRITITPAANQSGTAVITLTLKDDGQVINVGDVDTLTMPFNLTVTPVNNPPVFKSTITTIETNEGGAVQSDAFQVDEDAGSSPDENAQYITIDSIISDNQNVLPDSAITLFYDLNDNGVEDAGERRCAIAQVGIQAGCTLAKTVLEGSKTSGLDVKFHKFYLKLDPVDGISGNANLTMKISDHIDPSDPLSADPTYLPLTNQISNSFSFIVHPIAALHGGWSNISSVGIKTDKLDTPVSAAEIQCNYNKIADAKHCGSSDCTGSASPNGTITPDAKNVIYWDSSAKRCYRSTALDKYSWVDFNTSCPVTRTTNSADICSGNNCITEAASPYPSGTEIPGVAGLYLYNIDPTSGKGVCYVSTDTQTNTDWQVYVPSKVTLSWKQFVMVGSGADSSVQIAGWNVYRREAGTDYNFKGGHLKNTSSTSDFTITDPSIRTFTDTTAVAGKIYYYVVRPVDNSIRKFPTYTPEMFSEARIIASPANYSFVHRWMINQEVCNSMNITTTTSPSHIDQTKNFRCEYQGPGESATYPGYYDYGKDILVDTQELGCPYAPAPKCSANGCVGVGAPTITADLVEDDLYYDRSTGTCSRFDSGSSTFVEMDSAFTITDALATSLKSALNAPLVNISQARAVDICAARNSPFFYRKDNVTLAAGLSVHAILPNKKDYIAYSAQRSDMTDPEITEMEQGYSLNIQSRCNGSAASGLETAFNDSAIPSTSFIYSLPGTYSSNIRSLYTGSIPWASSKGTEACVSRYGIQDLYGNVAEWTSDRLSCPKFLVDGVTPNHACSSSGTGAIYEYSFNGKKYGFENVTGPFNDTEMGTGLDGPSPLDTDLTSWVFGDMFFTASKFSFPVGLPISSNITSDATTSASAAIPYLLDIGPSSGITSNRLHEDGMIPNVTSVRNNGETGGFAVGGSYLSGNKAGRYTSELIPVAFKRPDVGLRCIIPVMIYSTGDTQYTYPY